MTLVERLRLGGPNAAEVTDRAAVTIEILVDLVQVLIDNDPNADAADAVSVLDVWRQRAVEIIAKTQEG